MGQSFQSKPQRPTQISTNHLLLLSFDYRRLGPRLQYAKPDFSFSLLGRAENVCLKTKVQNFPPLERRNTIRHTTSNDQFGVECRCQQKSIFPFFKEKSIFNWIFFTNSSFETKYMRMKITQVYNFCRH